MDDEPQEGISDMPDGSKRVWVRRNGKVHFMVLAPGTAMDIERVEFMATALRAFAEQPPADLHDGKQYP